MTEVVRVVVADDHPLFRDGLRTALQGVDDIELVGEASTGPEAVEMAASLMPSIVLLDLQMPGRNGIEVTQEIMAARPDSRVVMLTMNDEPAMVLAALRAGAAGYLLKGADRADLLAAIRAVARGETVFGPGVAATVVSSATGAPPRIPPELAGLSEREREVLELVASGLTNAAIGARLYVSPKTVRNHVSNVLTKLGAASRGEAAEIARRVATGRVDTTRQDVARES